MMDDTELSEFDNGTIQLLLQSAVRTLGMIPLEKFEAYVEFHERSLNHWHALGPLLHPTEYRDGYRKTEDAEYQLKIAKALLEARRIAEEREIAFGHKRPEGK
jgi:hypothetical protein